MNELKEGIIRNNTIINKEQADLEPSVEMLRTQTVNMLHNTSDSCKAEIGKSVVTVNAKINTMDDVIKTIKDRIPTYSIMDDEWLLFFRTEPGNYNGVYRAWEYAFNTRSSSNMFDRLFGGDFYRNNAVNIWNNLDVSFVRLALFYKIGKEVAFLLFDGIGSDKISWFYKERLLDSPLGQLRYDSSLNHFSIAGEGSIKRRFFTNVRYGGCGSDHGFLLVLDSDSH